MSAAIVRKALDISEDSPGPLQKPRKNSGRTKLKSIEKKKKSKLSPDELLKKNLKILKSLEFASRAKKYGKNPNPTELPPSESTSSSTSVSKKSKKKKKEDNSAFTEEDFETFEKEYFVSG